MMPVPARRSVTCALRRAVPGLALVLGIPVVTLGSLTASAASTAAQPCAPSIAGISVYGGNEQVAKVGTAFGAPLQALVVSSCNGAPYTSGGVDVEFIAPVSGASGSFTGSTLSVTEEAGSNGVATAPQFTANEVSGTFDVEAMIVSTSYSTDFQLTSTTVGAVSSVTVSSGNNQSAHIGEEFASPLAVSITDAYGDPVAGTTVVFTVVTTNGAGATFVGGGAGASEQTNESGVATSPLLSAGDTAGAFTVTATVSGVASEATFSLTDVSGAPYAIAAGVGSTQETQLGSDFPVPLAVTVTDNDGNAVVGATVTFSAPESGPTGLFAGSGTRATVVTNSDGIATAPDFSATGQTGGYVVTASVAGLAQPATFAMVNEPRAGASAPGPYGSYWLVTRSGQVLSSGSAPNWGSVTTKLASPVAGMAATPGGLGYWLVSAKGVVYAFGNAVNDGSPATLHLAKPIVGIAATPDGKGYWLVASDGGIFNYGDAKFYGSPATLHLARPIVGIAATPDGKGYWLVGSDGGIFNYGDAKFYGSPARQRTVTIILGIASTPTGDGYWLLSSNGTVIAYGQATVFGSAKGLVPMPVKALVRTADGYGYWVVSANGTAAGFGDAGAQGSALVSAKTVVTGTS